MLVVFLIAFGAFAIDIANLILVKGELQNAADSAAQAGAQCLYRRTECANMSASVPDFANANTRAQLAAPNNAVQGLAVSDSEVQTGYWNITGTPGTLQPQSITPTANDFPAVQVTLSKESGKNGGAVVFYLAKIMALFDNTGAPAKGLDYADVSAKAVSVVTPPGVVNPGGLFPFAMAQCMYTTYWKDGQPVNATVTGPDAYSVPQIAGQPIVFRFGFSTLAYGACEGGQFTSFALDANSTSAIQALIANGNPTPMAVGDNTWIEPGAKAAIYKTVNDCSAAGNKKCEYVTIPVTANASATVKGEQPIKAFGCMHILLADQGAKYIQVQMSNACPPYSGGGVGPYYGVVNPPHLGL